MEPIIITAGGTAGHVFPALAVAQELVLHKKDIIFVTDQRGKKYLPPQTPFTVHVLMLTGGGAQSWIRKILGLFSLIKGLWYCLAYLPLRRAKVVGFGGHASIPCLVAALLFRRPIILHEQNAAMGKVNRLFGRWAKKVALSFAKTTLVSAKIKAKTVVTGLPVRAALYAIPAYKPPGRTESVNILILGGSQGARAFAEYIPEALAALSPADCRRIKLRHHARPEDIDRLKKIYIKHNILAEVSTFFQDIADCYAWAHLVVSRSGSTTGEIAAVKRPAVFIPFPYAADDHQAQNASAVVGDKAGWVVPETKQLAGELTNILKLVLADSKILTAAHHALADKEKKMSPTEHIMKLIGDVYK